MMANNLALVDVMCNVNSMVNSFLNTIRMWIDM